MPRPMDLVLYESPWGDLELGYVLDADDQAIESIHVAPLQSRSVGANPLRASVWIQVRQIHAVYRPVNLEMEGASE